ncbi:hypothetical protein FF80_03251 [Devosia sp. LC5]|uniref:hypothetical protein n=1 Tax=Devosia sp. LC5 TaxID=1502724 RepID=UPI0004E3CEF5|nr:hypothetical protein [Devosia sp. LC5]KFC62685.1 hypothetical protein FF80_03251 [Devosia sp. LC5]
MTRISPLYAAAVAFGLGLFTAPAVMAQASACANPGTYAFSSITLGSTEFLPSVAKQFAAAGLMAQRGNCTVRVICPRADETEAGEAQAALTCRAIQGIVIRGGSAASFNREDVKNNRPRPGNGMSAGSAYIVLQ